MKNDVNMNINCEFAPRPKLKSVVAFRLPMTKTGSSWSSETGRIRRSYEYQYIQCDYPRSGRARIGILSGSYGCSWIDADDEQKIMFVLNTLKRLGYHDVVIEEKLIIDED